MAKGFERLAPKGSSSFSVGKVLLLNSVQSALCLDIYFQLVTHLLMTPIRKVNRPTEFYCLKRRWKGLIACVNGKLASVDGTEAGRFAPRSDALFSD